MLVIKREEEHEEHEEGNYGANVALFVGMMIYMVVSLSMYIGLRRHAIIYHRKWGLVVGISLLYWVNMIRNMCDLLELVDLENVTSFLLFPLIVFFRTMRVGYILKEYYWNQMLIKNKVDGEKGFKGIDKWLIKLLRVETKDDSDVSTQNSTILNSDSQLSVVKESPVLSIGFMLIFGIGSILTIIYYAMGIHDSDKIMYWFFLAYCLVLALVSVPLLAKEKDNYFIKHEMILSAVLVAFFALVVEILEVAPGTAGSEWVEDWEHHEHFIVGMIDTGILLWFPIGVYFYQKMQIKRIAEGKVTFQALDVILQTAETCEKFKEFVAMDYCSENIAFLEDVMIFKSLAKEERKKYAKKMYDIYIKYNGMMVLNLSADEVIVIKSKLESDTVNADLFESCELQVKNLLVENNLRRFLSQ